MSIRESDLLRSQSRDLSKMIRAYKREVVIIGVQHILESTVSLFQYLLKAGIKKENVFLTGKIYSENKESAHKLTSLGINYINTSLQKESDYDLSFKNLLSQLWEIFFAANYNENITLIVIDDGGKLIKSIPRQAIKKYHVIAIEQTTSGIEKKGSNSIPVIEVATSAVKRIIEPHLISEAIIDKLLKNYESISLNHSGVIGKGYLGSVLFNYLKTGYTNIKAYDITESFETCRNLFTTSRLIIGATGHDISKTIEHHLPKGHEVNLCSVSSSDVEFRALKQTALMSNSYTNEERILRFKKGQSNFNLLNRGYPINFDNSSESVKFDKIILTRSLIFQAVIQALQIDKNSYAVKKVMINPESQRKILFNWIDGLRNKILPELLKPEVISNFENTKWIELNSGGYRMPISTSFI